MQNEFQIDALIIRYLSDETSKEEDDVVKSWINKTTENRIYFEQIQSAWILASANKIISGIDIDEEWLSIRRSLSAAQTGLTPHNFHSQFMKAPVKTGPGDANEDGSNEGETNKGRSIDGGTIERRRSKDPHKPEERRLFYKVIFASAAAASVIGIMIFLYVWEPNTTKDITDITRKDYPAQKSSAPGLRYEENNSGQTRPLILPDGSKVSLFPNSTLGFHEPFINNKRELTVVGKAAFVVWKDASRPFIVNSDQISTTALGTNFTVTNFKNSGNITIQLSEGKVVVQSTASAVNKFDKKYYLLPGEELVYIKGTSGATIRRSKKGIKQISGNTGQLEYDSISIPKAGEVSWYMFNNQPLPQVFEKLERLYDVDIDFSEKAMRNFYFIGRFNYSDSLEKILREIAEINDLKVIKEKGRFQIKK